MVAKSESPDVLSSPPSGDDPREVAHYFMDMLAALGAHGGEEAKRLRAALIELVTRYRDNPDKEEGRRELMLHMAGLEAAVSELVLDNTRKMRDRFAKDAQRVPKNTPAGKMLRTAVEGFGLLVQALEAMSQASRQGDAALRARAHAMLAEAKAALEPLQKR